MTDNMIPNTPQDDAARLMQAAGDALTDGMVERLFTFIEHMLNTVGNENLASLVDDARVALDEAVEETANRPVSGGVLATLSMLGKPECQRALQFMLCFSDKLQSRQKK